ncbi:hypothetical protein [Kitasatospora sp. NPDC089509]|uniref:hypothetical protein n=1 Tax=Kitasatospora sp. NPDC089509 TaxID=3364079 RepID=UPI0037F7A22D
MEHIVDLDRAAERITARTPHWHAAGLVVGAPTWRADGAPWPQPLETDRSRVADPDSVGVEVVDPRTGAELHVVLFRGGWADVDYLARDWAVEGSEACEGETAGAGVFPAQGIVSDTDFEERLIAWTVEVFGR